MVYNFKLFLKNSMMLVIWNSGKVLSRVFSYSLYKKTNAIYRRFYSSWLSTEFAKFHSSSTIQSHLGLVGGKYISVGSNTHIGERVTLTAWDNYHDQNFFPEIIIGDNCNIGDDAHITAINRIIIGNNVLTGKKILITDNSHGSSLKSILELKPINRSLISKGPVLIGDNVWIGDKVSILSGVNIGVGSVIGSNSVVTKDVPPFCIVGGIPAKIILNLQ